MVGGLCWEGVVWRSGFCEWVWSGWGKGTGEVVFGGGVETLGCDDGVGAGGDGSLVGVWEGVEVVAGGAVAEGACAANIEGLAGKDALEIVNAKSVVLIRAAVRGWGARIMCAGAAVLILKGEVQGVWL